ncbi:tetratricopeptide repeat protein [Anaeromyxobacter paludicola]|uniref:Tetratricopeptide repeat protein n=1 Tax=Anaeromyxobacter paludicola TaxID=2918171 RepID=A0ABM7XEV5_9BACT|nr:hypothetical protein [Anaeromyxobacter paludicola]BDG10428.1 hypothetical protein AMPC_35410 [Anaeromyxobacter paludicola]
MSPRRAPARLAAALALALVAAAPAAARAGAVEEVEARLRALQDDAARLESGAAPAEAGPAERARRALAAGRARLAVSDHARAAALLAEAAEAPALEGTADGAEALWLLAQALDGQGSTAAAARAFERVAALRGPREREALPRAVDAAFRAGRYDRAAALADRARALLGKLPPDLAYTAAKAAFRRRDLPDAERRRRALAALEAVPAPHHLAAAYLQGVLQLEAGARDAAVARFEGCTRLDGKEPRQRELRELCHLALARLYGDAGRTAEAISQYQRVSRDSPRFDEALYELAWTWVRAKKHALALRTAALLADLAPESPLAPEALLLQGRLELELGHWRPAVESYERVVSRWGPVRDELEAILAAGEDPLRSFNEIVGRPDAGLEAAAVLPPLARRWAAEDGGLERALGVVGALEEGRRDLGEATELSARLGAALSAEGEGTPRAREALARADAVANGLLLARAALARAEEAELGLEAGDRAELASLRAARQPLEGRLAALPASAAAADERVRRARAGIDALDAEAFRLGFEARAESAAIAGTRGWLERRAPAARDPSDRAAVAEELRRQREIVSGYAEEARQLRLDLALAEDAARAQAASAGDEKLRSAFAARLAEEEALLARARQGRPAAGRLEAVDAARGRAAALEAATAAARSRLAAQAAAGREALRAQAQAQADELGREQAELERLQEEVRRAVGRVTTRSLERVRGQFQQLVLEADVGLVDVAWARKRDRAERIQQLSAQKQAELDRLDAEARGAPGKVER